MNVMWKYMEQVLKIMYYILSLHMIHDLSRFLSNEMYDLLDIKKKEKGKY